MRMMLQALITLIERDEIYIGSESVKNKTILDLMRLQNSPGSTTETVNELAHILSRTVGERKAWHILKMVYNDYGHDMTSDERITYENIVIRLEEKLKQAGIPLGERIHSPLREEEEHIHFPSTPHSSSVTRQILERNNNSYSGADMVATITIPGRGPIVFGELANVSYSVFREKVPVRALGRVSMKGYTRGMRTITGILSFIMFDESIVYRCIEELNRYGYRMLMDEMPLFDITLTMANEYGSKSSLTIYGVTTYTEGMVMSINDMMTQNVYDFYALDIDPMAKITH